ncbi:MAG: T9SS type A sorting domain-containing protein [Bacteroidota bacterium]
MRKLTILSLLMALAAVLGGSPATAQTVGNCALGSATKDLDANNVQARLYNNGGLFWRGSGNVYTIPKNGNANSVFASGIWIGGIDANGELRFAGTAYGPWEFWPGPLDENGNPPADCSQFDNVWKVTQDDLARYDETGEATSDMQTWPWTLGAPVEDGDGDPNNYNLAGGDRPEVTGEQTAWWVMNDVGGTKAWSGTAPIGLEVQVTAFAFRTSDALNNTTFYKYRLIQKGNTPLNDVYFGIWSDPDLGNAADDYVGSDSTLGLGYVYNGESVDAGLDGYGDTPPALAYDFFQGPLVPAEGQTHTDPDGTVYENSRRLNMTRFVYYNNDSTPLGNPSGTTEEPYNYLRGIWRDGQPITFGGTGYGGTQETNFMFPGDPVSGEFWSEENTDGAGARNTPADRRFLMSTGPFDLTPGDEQEIVYGIVWARSTNRLASVAQMRFDDILAQGAFNSNFDIPAPPDAPDFTAESADSGVILEWSYSPTSNNFLNAYDEPSAFLVDTNPADGNTTYTFEGYRVFQYDSAIQDANSGTVIATFDVPNNVTTIVDDAIDLATGGVITRVVANGSDSGVRNYLEVANLINGTEYHFGIQAYAYNNNSSPQIYASPIERVSVIPTAPTSREGGTVVQSTTADRISSARTTGVGDSFGVFATVSNPLAVTGDSYEVRIYGAMLPDSTEVQTYDIINATTGDRLIDGAAYIAANGRNVPLGDDILVADGLSFSVGGAPPDFSDFRVVANASGPLADPAGASSDWQGFPGIGRSSRGGPQQTGDGLWHIHTGDNGTRASYEAFLARSVLGRAQGWSNLVPNDFEWRFTARCLDSFLAGTPECFGYDRFAVSTTDRGLIPVPFEVWNIGIGTIDDPSDDYRLIPAVIDWDDDGWGLQDIDHTGSGANNDPHTDWLYWYIPNDASPGEAGYNAWLSAAQADIGTVLGHGPEIIGRLVLFNWNGGEVAEDATYNAEYPEAGTIFQMTTTKPLANGDVFSITSAESAPLTQQADAAQEALESIRVVPNPYKAVSSYETDLRSDKVRFINLPTEANISIYTLDGTLIRSLQKSSAGTTLDWDLTNQEALPIASGMYIIHIDAPGVGEKIIKFGAVIGRTQLDLF